MVRYLREENPKPRWRPLRDSPQGTLMAAGVPVMLVVGRRKRKAVGRGGRGDRGANAVT
jgi:hypothetical protein